MIRPITWVLPTLCGAALTVAPVLHNQTIEPSGPPVNTATIDATSADLSGPRQTSLDIAALPAGTFVDIAASTSQLVATVRGIPVHTPVKTSALHGFHEASSLESLDFAPLEGVDYEQPHEDELAAMVLPSRGRSNGPTSALDVVGMPQQQVLSPIDGKVIGVERYKLYGRYDDVKILIRSSHDPSVVFTILHVESPRIKVGDTVRAGLSPIAERARQFNFESQIDKFVGYAAAHVHVEAKLA